MKVRSEGGREGGKGGLWRTLINTYIYIFSLSLKREFDSLLEIKGLNNPPN